MCCKTGVLCPLTDYCLEAKDHIPCTGGAESLRQEEMGLQARGLDGLGSLPDPPSL